MKEKELKKYTRHNPCNVSIIERNNLCCQKTNRHMYEVVIDHQNALKYNIGDSIGIYPLNRQKQVYNVLSILNMPANYPIQECTTSNTTTLFDYLLNFVDINSSTNVIDQLTDTPNQKYISWNDIQPLLISDQLKLDIIYSLKKIAPRFIQSAQILIQINIFILRSALIEMTTLDFVALFYVTEQINITSKVLFNQHVILVSLILFHQ